MKIESPHLASPVPATYESIAELIPRLVGRPDPFTIVRAGDEQTYAQVLWTLSGFSLDYQAGSMARHYRSVRDDLTVAETIAALNSYAAGAPIWSLGLEFRRVELRSGWYLAGWRVGQIGGRLLRPLYRLFR